MRILVLGGTGELRVGRIAGEHDVVVSAIRAQPGQVETFAALTRGLASAVSRADRRLVVVGGAGPLRVPDTRSPALDDPRYVPAEGRPAARASVRQLEVLREDPHWDFAQV